MSMEFLSRSCADVIEQIGGRTDIARCRRQNMQSALRRFCRLLRQTRPTFVPTPKSSAANSQGSRGRHPGLPRGATVT